ncbi:MAG: hypothetical protein JSS01_02870 [Proteobacteria bacterium]|nr:hypothetical protein [Pseudomonadota bacterium]
MTRVVLHIGRLVLRGVDAADAHQVAGALQAELGRQLGVDAGAALVAGGNRALLRAGRVTLAPGDGGQSLGRAVAERIAGPEASGRSS